MKKILIILIILLVLGNTNTLKKEEDVLRVRVIANSNSEYDQNLKNKISNNLKYELYELLKDEQDISKARIKINNNINNLSKVVEEGLKNEEYSYTINYGLNYFPEKKYQGKKYKEGNYESLLVKLGKAEGDNWWCILFPPLCLIEGEETEKEEEVEYQFFFKTILDKFLH